MTHDLREGGSALREIEELSEAGLTAQQLFDAVTPIVDRVIRSDGYFMGATDPETTLCIGFGAHRDLPVETCQPTWDHEFLVPDFMKYVDIASSGRYVADMHEETGGNPMRSARWREIQAPLGFRSEVRAAFTLGGSIWGVAQFNRLGDVARFSDAEKVWLAQVSPLMAQGLRRAMITHDVSAPAPRAPGVMLLDADARVVSANAEAAAWLGEVDTATSGYYADGAVPLPFETQAYASRVRATPPGETPPPTRLRTRDGVWLLLQGSLLEGTDNLALVVQPAKASDVAPLIVEAYELTDREVDVTKLIARGLGTAEIASTLFLSPHTVRDHVKSVFEKTGVSSRGELTAKVFAEHYAPIPH